jgi:hypothetical protein
MTRVSLSRGHGTYVEGEGVIASVTGVITRVNKLVTVRAVKSRYGYIYRTFSFPFLYNCSTAIGIVPKLGIWSLAELLKSVELHAS